MMDQQSIEQWLNANGGASLKHSPRAGSKRVRNPNYLKPGHLGEDEFIDVQLQSWTNPTTGATLTVYQTPGSTEYEIEKQIDANPQARGSASPNESVSAPANQPWIAQRKPDGSVEWIQNRNYDGSKKASGQPYKNQSGQWVQRFDDGTTEVLPAEAVPFEKDSQSTSATGKKRTPVKGHPGIYEVTEASKETQGGASTESSNTYYEDESGNRVAQPTDPVKPDRVTTKEGQILERQPDGSYKEITVQGAIQPGQGPSLQDLQTRYGMITEDLTAYAAKLQDALARGVITQADFDKRWGEAKAVANTKVQELNNIASTQRAIYSDQSANWRQEQATANTRLNASSQALQLGVQAADKLQGASGANQMGTIWSTLTAGRAAGEMYGGYASGKAPALPLALQSIMELEIPGLGTIKINPQGQQQSAGGGSGAALPASIQSIDDAVNADITAAQSSRDQTPAPGMSFSGGQLRAPGYSADMGAPPRNPMPVSAAMAMVSPDILGDFGEDIVAEALQGMPEYGY